MMMRHKTQGRRIQMRKKGRSRKAFFFSHLCPDLFEGNETFFIWLILATKLTVLLRLMSHLLNNCLFYKASACALRLNIFLKITNLCHRKHDWFSCSLYENYSIFGKKNILPRLETNQWDIRCSTQHFSQECITSVILIVRKHFF